MGLMSPHISNCRPAEKVQSRAIALQPYTHSPPTSPPHTLPDTIRMKGLSEVNGLAYH